MEPIQLTTNPATSRPTREAAPARPAPAAERVEAPAAYATDPRTKPTEENQASAGPERPQSLDVRESVERLNELIQSVRRELQFSVDEDSGRTVIKVIDSATQEVVRQIPPEEVMTLVDRLATDRPSLMADLEA